MSKKSPNTNPPDDFFLWHLAMLKLVEESSIVFSNVDVDVDVDVDVKFFKPSQIWEKAEAAAKNGETVTVALIDTGIDEGHPNLEKNCSGQIDYGPDFNGVKYRPPTLHLEELRRRKEAGDYGTNWLDLANKALDEVLRLYDRQGPKAESVFEVLTGLKKIRAGGKPDAALIDKLLDLPSGKTVVDKLTPDESQYVTEAKALLDGLAVDKAARAERDRIRDAIGPVKTLPLEDVSRFFGSHGTACAGLVAGHPPEDVPPHQPGPIPYHGVNPWCKVLSLATPYSHELQPVICALIRAFLSKAEVIYIPRGVPDPVARADLMRGSFGGTRIDQKINLSLPNDGFVQPEDQASLARLTAQKTIFEALLLHIAKERYVILAAGNDGLADDLSYPARVIKQEKSALADKVIVVGALNRSGLFSAYTNGDGDKLKGKLFWMLSDDDEAIDRRHFSVDKRSFYGTDYDYGSITGKGIDGNTFNPWSLLSLDVRGSFGRAEGPGPEEPVGDAGDDLASLYTLFSGTSAASALVAGLTSLAILTTKEHKVPNKAKLKAWIKKHYPLVVGPT